MREKKLRIKNQKIMEKIKKIREITGAGVMDVKRALDESGGDEEKALKLLKEKGLQKAEKRSERETAQGLIDCYIHLGRIGAMVEVNCETDFVARNEDFKQFVREIAIQVAQSTCETVEQLKDEVYFRDERKTVADVLSEIVSKTGENVRISRFERFVLGE